MLLLSLSLALSASTYDFKVAHNLVDGPSAFGDSGVDYQPYAAMERSLAQLAADHPDLATFVHYGKSVDGRNLNALRIAKADKAGLAGAPAVEISGAIHGNEYLGIEAKLGQHFIEDGAGMPGLTAYLDRGGVIYVIPVVNPDGYESRERGNSHGSDLNRNFDIPPLSDQRLTEPESKALAEYVGNDLGASGLALKLTFDYHCCVPALVMPWTYKDAQPAAEDASRFNFVAQLQKDTLGYIAGNAADTVGYLAAGTTVDYFYAKYDAVGLTLEGQYGGEEAKLDKHVAMWDAIFAAIASDKL
jgi:hypothetical protein